MIAIRRAPRYRFGIFEADAATGELRRQGVRVRLPAQSFQVLLLLLSKPGELVTREEICRELWPDGTFVDYDHGVNSAINRLREALGDKAGSARFLETLARRGYRFIAPVQSLDSENSPVLPQAGETITSAPPGTASTSTDPLPFSPPRIFDRVLASPEDLPKAPPRLVRTLFLLFQAMYLAFYVAALANLPEVAQLAAVVNAGGVLYYVIFISAVALIPIRTFLFSAVVFHAPRIHAQFQTVWPFLLIADLAWSLSPFLLLHHINFGTALACVPFLVYSPFAQRALMLMAAGSALHSIGAAPKLMKERHES